MNDSINNTVKCNPVTKWDRQQVYMMFTSYWRRNIPRKERLNQCWSEYNFQKAYGVTHFMALIGAAGI